MQCGFSELITFILVARVTGDNSKTNIWRVKSGKIFIGRCKISGFCNMTVDIFYIPVVLD